MFLLNDDNSIYATRGDVVFFAVSADDDGVPFMFQPGDVVRMKVYGKKAADNVVLQAYFPVTEETESVGIFLSEEDTKIGEVISKPVDYWYEVELNPEDNPRTIIGYDEDGPKVFRLFPEGADIEAYVPDPEDIPVVDDELDMTSTRPIQNQAVARELANLTALVNNLLGKIYPVGSVYVSVNETDPSVLFGGTWERLKDHFLLASGDRFAAGEMDGEEVVILNEDQIPSHTHEVRYLVEGQGVAPEGHTLLAGTYETVVGQVQSMYIHSGGGNEAHNNMPPYLAVYMWKRIA